MQGARKIVNYQGRRSIISKFASYKMNATIITESLLEFDYVFHLEFDQDVIEYRAQPFSIHYYLNGEKHKYTPDFWVKRQDCIEIVEIKPLNKLYKYQNIFPQIRKVLKEYDSLFSVISEDIIRNQPLLYNLKLLHRYSRTSYSIDHHDQIINWIRNRHVTPVTIGDCIDFMIQNDISLSVLYSQLFHHYLKVPINEPISDETIIEIGEANNYADISIKNRSEV